MLSLFFCSYTEVINITSAGRNHVLHSIISRDSESPLPLPDYAHMIPYKPKANSLPGEHPVPGNYKINNLYNENH